MLHFTINRDLNPNGASLRKLLKAHVIYERMTAAKKFSLYLLAIVGVVLWVGTMWPAFLPPRALDFALALWGGLLFLAILASVEEWLWHRRVARYRSEHQARQKEDVGRTG